MKQTAQRLRSLWNGPLAQCRGALAVLALGTLLLLLPSGRGEQTPAEQVQSGVETFDLEAFEGKLSRTLSRIEGAGEVDVVLALDSGSRRVLAQDREQNERGVSATTVTVGKGSGTQEVVALQIVSPSFRGALVVCSGGRDPSVRLELTRAVAALTGLGADCISVCAGGT